MNREKIEQEIRDKGLYAPKVTADMVDEVIKSYQYHVFDGSQLTICCITLINGFTVTGESACVSIENYNKEIGFKIAKEKAIDKIWMLEGYLLKQNLYNSENTINLS